MQKECMTGFFTLRWCEDGIEILDQRALPHQEEYLLLRSVAEVVQAICSLAIRGAPALGVCGAMGMALAAQNSTATTLSEMKNDIRVAARKIAAARPTAVNLAWGVERLLKISEEFAGGVTELRQKLIAEAQRTLDEDIAINRRIGQLGAALLQDGDTVLTHCNAGALATAGFGTALGVIYAAHAQGKRIQVFADETRPVLQGARLTAWELQKSGITTTLICDNMAASLMAQGKIQKIIVGADRIALNGDVANKIGTYGVAVCARYHGIPFYVAAPLSTLDASCPSGGAIPIEERDPSEVTHLQGQRIAPAGIAVLNPAFDVTPARLVSAIITEKAVVHEPSTDSISKLLRP